MKFMATFALVAVLTLVACVSPSTIPNPDSTESDVVDATSSEDTATNESAGEESSLTDPIDTTTPETAEVTDEVTPDGVDGVDSVPEVAETETTDPETTPEAVEAEDEVVVVPPVWECVPGDGDIGLKCDDGKAQTADYCDFDPELGSECKSVNCYPYYFQIINLDFDNDTWYDLPYGVTKDNTCNGNDECWTKVLNRLSSYIPGSLADCAGDDDAYIYPGAPESYNNCYELYPEGWF
ncbi:MAG: hypothetical protein WA057_05260 [Candidatus Magasanikiibacteriota bacterium]